MWYKARERRFITGINLNSCFFAVPFLTSADVNMQNRLFQRRSLDTSSGVADLCWTAEQHHLVASDAAENQ